MTRWGEGESGAGGGATRKKNTVRNIDGEARRGEGWKVNPENKNGQCFNQALYRKPKSLNKFISEMGER